MKEIIIVDNERILLKDLQEILKDEPYEVFYTASGIAALEYLKTHTIEMIIADVTLLDVEAEELLSQVKSEYPKIIRVAMCYLNEQRRIAKMIEKGLAKQYLFKPWNEDLKYEIRNILSVQERLLDANNLGKINELSELPSLPSLYVEVSKLVEKDVHIKKITTLISKDQAVASKILKIANSAYYGRKTGDIHEAVMTLGLNYVKNLILSNSLFNNPSHKMKILWEHTEITNRLCIAFYEQCLHKSIPTLFASVGLLHDIGRVLIYLLFEQEYKEMMMHIGNHSESLLDLEMKHFGATHQEIGAYLLNLWDLPHAYVEAAMFHHTPLDERVVNRELIAVVHLANYYAITQIQKADTHHRLDEQVFDILNLNEEDFLKVVETVKEEIQ